MPSDATRDFPSAMESMIVVASNRGPVSFDHDASGALTSQRGAGGLVTALSGVFFRDETTWVAAAMSDGDREVADEGYEIDPDSHQRVRFVVVPPERYDAYYNQMANRILWFLHHYLWDTARTPVFDETTEATWHEFVEANRSFAITLAEEGDRDPVYLIQDYHLALVPGMLRELRPDARIVHFTHTPFAGATYLRILPSHMRDAILRGMAGADVVGFQARPWVESFLLSVRGLPGCRVLRGGRFVIDDRVATARAFPVAVSAHSIRETAARPEIKQIRDELKAWKGGTALLLRVDRLEPSKNILRGFLAYELFLRSNPSWQGRVTFLALFSPSREALPEYQAYGDDCLSEVERINKELSTEHWQPIEVRIQEDYGYAVGAYGLYDVLLVNPIYDGMNLVAMEGPLVNRQGALVLSRNAGAYGRLGKHAITVNPFDIRETADAIRDALEMPEDERRRRGRGLSRTVQAHTPPQWLASQLEALDSVRPPRD
jgi:trehalose 6-phosphate synthase